MAGLLMTARTNVLVLAIAQALFQTVSVLVVTIGALAAARITSDLQLATVPIAAMVFGTALATVPASLFMARFGRRRGFLLGALLGVAGGLLAATGIWMNSLAALAAGTALVGGYQAFAQFYRFAAAEITGEKFQSQAISYVLAGGVVAALAGPELGRWGAAWLEPPFLGSFLIVSVVSLLSAGLLLGLQPPGLVAIRAHKRAARPLVHIMRQETYLVALFGAATGYGVMILAMTATPLAMVHLHHDMAGAVRVIQVHVLGMFLPSFFTGALIARFGVLNVMLAGVALLAAHVAFALSGTTFPSFAAALLLLGVGWNFLYIGGTTLLTEAYFESERGKAQAANDLIVFAVGLFSSLAAGALLSLLGWQALNAVLLPWLACAALAIAWLSTKRRSNAVQS